LADIILKKNKGMTDQTKEQLMFSLIEVRKQGAQSQQEFCKEKDLDYHQFQYWVRKHRATHSTTPVTDKKFFKQIKVNEAPLLACSMELIFPDGKRLIFHQPVEAPYVRLLLS
jgi:hypothetical protein